MYYYDVEKLLVRKLNKELSWELSATHMIHDSTSKADYRTLLAVRVSPSRAARRASPRLVTW